MASEIHSVDSVGQRFFSTFHAVAKEFITRYENDGYDYPGGVKEKILESKLPKWRAAEIPRE